MAGPGKWHYVDDSEWYRHFNHEDIEYGKIKHTYLSMSGANRRYLIENISDLIKNYGCGKPVSENIIVDSLEKKMWHYRFESRNRE